MIQRIKQILHTHQLNQPMLFLILKLWAMETSKMRFLNWKNAQVDIRNDLLNCKTKYADVDAQYKLIKAERAALKNKLKLLKSELKEIDKAKEKIRKIC